MVYGIIGTGSIASAIVEGLCAEPEGRPLPPILLSPRNRDVAQRLAARHDNVSVAADNQAVVDGASVVVLCLRPLDARAVLSTLEFAPRHSVVSVIAGCSSAAVRDLVAPADKVTRAAPLMSVASRDCATPITGRDPAAELLFTSLGSVVILDEEETFEALSATMGTVSMLLAYLAALSRWLGSKKVPEEVARAHVAAILSGIDAGVRNGANDFDRLSREHATPGGINELFLTQLEAAGIFTKIDQGLDRIFDRLMNYTSFDG